MKWHITLNIYMYSLLRYILNEPNAFLQSYNSDNNVTRHPNNLLPYHVYNRRQLKINIGHLVHGLTNRGTDPSDQNTRSWNLFDNGRGASEIDT